MTAVREGQTFDGRSLLVRYVNFVKLPHTVFALPFALVGATLASYRAPVSWTSLGWIVLAFTAVRFAAMGFNRIVDRDIDARNPRTANRELPRGALSLRQAVVAVVVMSAVFVFAAWQLNAVCGWLSPVALGWVLFYSYTKRFTRLCHIVLCIGLSIAPVGGYLAVTGQWSDPWWMLVLLAAAVATWVGGFDILYALQDIDFDCAQGLHSLPASLGERNALNVARFLHVCTVLALAGVGIAVGAHWIYAAGVLVATVLLLYEHSLVKPGDLRRLDAAFFTMNGVISILFFAFVLTERLQS
ncbi:MAG: putative 4-hydroxybenzoate polyprenyltransferase [Gemmatimonadota bacterium]|nr:putative 4-hydroxybenzoate polyprenyltransferase [Gemmatimonadota bacterium]